MIVAFVYNAFTYGLENLSNLIWCFIYLPYKNLLTLPSAGRMRMFTRIFSFNYFQEICLCKASLNCFFLLDSKARKNQKNQKSKSEAVILRFINDEICKMTDAGSFFLLPQLKDTASIQTLQHVVTTYGSGLLHTESHTQHSRGCTVKFD